MTTNDFLLEIGCEELPPSSLQSLSLALKDNIAQQLEQEQLNFSTIKAFASPQRLAVLVTSLQAEQEPQVIERHGPSADKAFDKDGIPTLACIGFARSCNVSADQLQIEDTPKGKRVYCRVEQLGKKTRDLLPEMINTAIKKLPISKPMRWGSGDISFIRPVQWVVMMLDKEVIDSHVLGEKTNKETHGHHFHHPKAITITHPKEYQQILHTYGMVIADFKQRKETIRKQIEKAAADVGKVIIDENLLNQVTSVVEWPIALRGQFSTDFLEVPPEALITAMKVHQKCFPVVDEQGKLLPYFILVSNIESKNPQVVIHGNERVINARLSDAAFFYKNDCRHPLHTFAKRLENVVFQKALGTVSEKVDRIASLSAYIAKQIEQDASKAKHAAQLAKCDLMTDMVYEFPELQGVMGYYYAKKDNEPLEIAKAIEEHYLPRFSGDQLPESNLSCCVALADRLDTLVGILGINKIPTGDRDPFALRRAALGIARILIEKKLPLDLMKLLKEARRLYKVDLPNAEVVEQAFNFVMDRLRAWYLGQEVIPEIFSAVSARHPTTPLDFDQRVKALQQFQALPEASSLAAANKRVSNILRKQGGNNVPKNIDAQLFELEAEKQLAQQLEQQSERLSQLYQEANYTTALTELAALKTPVDNFFDDVMIMVEDNKVRKNRLALLAKLQKLFTQVADISLLP